MAIIKDDLKNIQRIKDVIEADPNIIHSVDNDGLLKSVRFGYPRKGDKTKQITYQYDGETPLAYVTTDDSLQKTSYPFGVSDSASVSQISVGYKIGIVTQIKDQQVNAEKQLYNLLTLMRTTLTADPTFKDPTSDDDPIFTRSIINESRWITKTKGDTLQVIEFTLLATIGETLIITIPGFGDLNIISDTGDDGRNNTVIPNDEGNTKRSKGDFVGVRFFEYEYDTTTFETIEDLIIADNTLDLTLQYPSGNVTYTAKLEYQRQAERFDGVRTVFLQANRETA